MASSAPPSSSPGPHASAIATLGQRLSRLIQPTVLLGPAGIWLALLLVFPTLTILQISLVPNFRPGQAVSGYGLDNYFKIVQPIADPIYLRVILRSVLFAFNSTLWCLILGFPVAYWIAVKSPPRWRNLLLVAFIMPLWTSSLLRSYAWITILRPTGVLNSFLGALGLPRAELLNTSTAVLIGLVYNFLPYMVLILYTSLEKLDKRLLEAAADLGAPPREAFWKVTVPQTLPAIAAGSLLVFITSLGDFVVPELLGGASSMTLSRLIFNQFLGATRNWGFGSSLSMILILAVSIAIALLIKYGDRDAENF